MVAMYYAAREGTCSVLVLILLLAVHAVSSTASPSDLHAASNSSLMWGPYRPNLYVGLRPRLPDSLLAGLMWANVDNYENFQDIRHACEQGDDIGGYGWEEYDARTGGRHVVRDLKMGIDLTTHFIKVPGEKAGHWILRVKGTPREDRPQNLRTSITFYMGLDGEGELSLDDAADAASSSGLPEEARLRGQTPGLGKFSVIIKDSQDTSVAPQINHPLARTRDLDRTSFLGVQVAQGSVWQAKEILLGALRESLLKIQELYGSDKMPAPALLYALPNVAVVGSNLHYLQRTFEGAFEFDVVYQSLEESTPSDYATQAFASARIADNKNSFDRKFATVFPLQTPFDGQSFSEFGKVLFSNLLGGIGYFHGTSIVDRSYSTSYDEDEESFWESAKTQLEASSGQEEGPSTLFTSVPSRPFFPRGFYWDEGFHLMPIGLWDQDLSLEIISSWFALMDENGWIGREQILGPEARSKVPLEFTTQYPHYANPPTLFIAIDQFLQRLEQGKHSLQDEEYISDVQVGQAHFANTDAKSGSKHLDDPDLALQFLQSLYPELQKHYEWFRRTQKGEVKLYDREAYSSKEAYRWRGRTPDHCLTSGIDDYPRAKPPHPGELHLDLHCWMGLMTSLLRNIAEQLGEAGDAAELSRIETGILRNLDDLYWSEEHNAYCDQTIDDYEENIPVCHFGYISIFPVLLGLLPPDHPHLASVLELIRHEDHLWSPYGLRSLSKQDEHYGTGENYWRGPIWININYLALSSLYRNYAYAEGPHKELALSIYQELRSNVVNTVEREYRRSGIIWEQYNPESGQGQRTKAFTGWTSMIVNIMAERY